MPVGSFINVIPPAGFVVIHLALLGVGAYLAYRSFGAGVGGFGWAFTLYALAEAFYISYHMDWTVILFAHTIAEVLDAAAFVTLFGAGIGRLGAGEPGAAEVGAARQTPAT